MRENGIPERAVPVKCGVWARGGDFGGFPKWREVVQLGWLVTGAFAPGTLVWVEANRVGCLGIPSPRTTTGGGMERSGHSRLGSIT